MQTIVFGKFEMDLLQRVISADGQIVALQPRPFDILAFLIANRERMVSRSEIIDAVWQGQIVVANNLTVQIAALRRTLGEHGGEGLIITRSGRGYRFVGKVVVPSEERPSENTSPPVAGSSAARSSWLASLRWRTLTGVAGLGLGVVIGTAFVAWPSRSHFAPRVQVETKPDTVFMTPDGYCKVDYEFRVADSVALQLATEDVRFFLTSGEPVSPASIRGRIYHGSLPIQGPGRGTYHNNIWLPPDVARAAMAEGRPDVYLRHLFHLTDADGHEVDVPAVLMIKFGTAASACAAG